MALPRVRQHLTHVTLGWLGVSRVRDVAKDVRVFPDWSPPAIPAALEREAELFVHDVLWVRGGKLAELLTSRRTFVDPGLAKLYGVTYPGRGQDFLPVTLPAERVGILTQAGLLAALAGVTETSVVHRGLFLRHDLLCLAEVPPPPEGVLEATASQTRNLTTERARADFRLGHPTCGPCHAMFDPFGLILESFDSIGRFRPDPKAPAANVTASTSAELAGRYTTAAELAARVGAGSELSRCLSRQLASYAVGRVLGPEHDCVVRDATARLQKGEIGIPDLFRTIALSPVLRARQ